jgi:hypothetical protein
MDAQQAYGHICGLQDAASREYAMAVQDEQASYYTDFLQISAGAQNQWRTAYETYLQELRASAAGDDALARASAAYRNLQREFGKIQEEYTKACETRWNRMADLLSAKSADARVRVLDGWIEYLKELRRTAVSQPESESAGKKPVS